MASAVAVALNTTRVHIRDLLKWTIRSDITSASSTTTTVPAAGPKSSAAAIVNVSEIEKLTWTVRIRSVDHPVTSVKATSTNHGDPTGWRINSPTETNRTTAPAAPTVQRKALRTTLFTSGIVPPIASGPSMSRFRLRRGLSSGRPGSAERDLIALLDDQVVWT